MKFSSKETNFVYTVLVSVTVVTISPLTTVSSTDEIVSVINLEDIIDGF
jgi:hypothetical protein